MGDCICSGCKNLKGIIGENGEVEEFECEFGFPSAKCDECDEEECSETCGNFVSDEEEDVERTVCCKGCGKELKKVMDDAGSDDEVFCVDCYLKK